MNLILHIDLDSFYASVEENRNPEIRGKPVVVCMFSGRGEGGAVATANYPARKLGIHSGQPLRTAKARASDEAVFLPADRHHYKVVSDRIMAIFRKHADAFEQRSIDEAYLQIAGSFTNARSLAKTIKQEVAEKEHLTCSVGIGKNKLIAKMASREQKPDGLTVAKDFSPFSHKPVDKLFGIGPKTLVILKRHRIHTINDLSRANLNMLIKEFGERKGRLLKEHAHGRDNEPVEEVVRQQLSRIGTLPKDTRSYKDIMLTLQQLIDDLYRRTKKEYVAFRTITLITITRIMEMKTKSHTLEKQSNKKQDITQAIETLLRSFLREHPDDVLRRVGVRVSSFDPPKQKKKQRALSDYK